MPGHAGSSSYLRRRSHCSVPDAGKLLHATLRAMQRRASISTEGINSFTRSRNRGPDQMRGSSIACLVSVLLRRGCRMERLCWLTTQQGALIGASAGCRSGMFVCSLCGLFFPSADTVDMYSISWLTTLMLSPPTAWCWMDG